MSSKKNPGKFDCYKAAEPDEEMFVLLGRDDFGATMVRLWIALRLHSFDEAQKCYAELVDAAESRGRSTNLVKMGEAQECADRMDAWLLLLDDRASKKAELNLHKHMSSIVKNARAYLKVVKKPAAKKKTKKKTK